MSPVTLGGAAAAVLLGRRRPATQYAGEAGDVRVRDGSNGGVSSRLARVAPAVGVAVGTEMLTGASAAALAEPSAAGASSRSSGLSCSAHCSRCFRALREKRHDGNTGIIGIVSVSAWFATWPIDVTNMDNT
jgi:hypothetical protein